MRIFVAKNKAMARKYTPSEFLKEKKLREIPVEFMAKFKEALSLIVPN